MIQYKQHPRLHWSPLEPCSSYQQPHNSYCHRPPQTPIFFLSFFPFCRNEFTIISFYKLLVLYTLQLSHTTVHVSKNTKMYYQPLHPRMKNSSIGYVSKFPASHNVCFVCRTPVVIVSPSMPSFFLFLFDSFGRKCSTLRSRWPCFMLRGITPATVVLAPQWFSFWSLRGSVLSVSSFLKIQWLVLLLYGTLNKKTQQYTLLSP